jgi:chromosome segregation ATPase
MDNEQNVIKELVDTELVSLKEDLEAIKNNIESYKKQIEPLKHRLEIVNECINEVAKRLNTLKSMPGNVVKQGSQPEHKPADKNEPKGLITPIGYSPKELAEKMEEIRKAEL